MANQLTVFGETAREISRCVQEAALDFPAFETPLKVCVLEDCRATCCHDGVVLSPEEAATLSALDGEQGIFQNEEGQWRTRLREAKHDEIPPAFPDHFEQTKCVFLDEQDRCHWQLRAIEEGKHPWYYKPISCWMHPVLLTRRAQHEGRPILTLLESTKDVARFASQTPCGQRCAGGLPARTTLAAELEMLGLLSGRDLLGELNAPSI